MPEGEPSAAALGGTRPSSTVAPKRLGRAGGRRRAFDVVVADARGCALSAPGLAAWLRGVAPSRIRGMVTVALVSDARVRELNRRYRRQDCATDVLSFPANPESRKPESRANRESRAKPESRPNPESRVNRESRAKPESRVNRESRANPESRIPNPFLGDIVIARGVARRQAREARHSELTELKVLALHGLLHLLGYDHQRDEGRMERIERRLRRKGGLRDGLIERAHA
jgi:probable rRNA maturation factor